MHKQQYVPIGIIIHNCIAQEHNSLLFYTLETNVSYIWNPLESCLGHALKMILYKMRENCQVKSY